MERREQTLEIWCQMGHRSRKGNDTHAHLVTGSTVRFAGGRELRSDPGKVNF